MLGVPAENFLHGSQHMVAVVGVVIASLVAAHVSLPVFYNMDMISVNQYLENRFDSVLIRKIISALTVIEVCFYLGGSALCPVTCTRFSDRPSSLGFHRAQRKRLRLLHDNRRHKSCRLD
ncbi:hypothetical protein MRX96_056291 [Rhipicephalus microplus]